MRILVSTYYFSPSIGGIETACLTLCEGLVQRGHDVTVVTMTPAAPGAIDTYPFAVVRCPSLIEQVRLVHRHDILWQNGICLRLAGLFMSTIPKVFVHHGPSKHVALKRFICASGHNIFVSKMMQDMIGLPGTIIPNSYDEATFRLMPDVSRDIDFVYVGRLVPEKGVDIFVAALARMAANGVSFGATIVGTGPEEDKLKAQAAAAGISDRLAFAGMVRGEALARLINRHRALVVPSRWEEPFGIVALEGLACGCVVVGSRSGGLVEAIGPAGPIVAKEDPDALAVTLTRLKSDPAYSQSFLGRTQAHLQRFTCKRLLDASEKVALDAVSARKPAWFPQEERHFDLFR